MTYIFFLILLIIGLIAAIAYVMTGKIEEHIIKDIKNLIDKEYEGTVPYPNKMTVTLNALMLKFKCCGMESYKDFSTARNWNRTKVVGKNVYRVRAPVVCCREDGKYTGTFGDPYFNEEYHVPVECYSDYYEDTDQLVGPGCVKKLKSFLFESSGNVNALAGVVLALQIGLLIWLLTECYQNEKFNTLSEWIHRPPEYEHEEPVEAPTIEIVQNQDDYPQPAVRRRRRSYGSYDYEPVGNGGRNRRSRDRRRSYTRDRGRSHTRDRRRSYSRDRTRSNKDRRKSYGDRYKGRKDRHRRRGGYDSRDYSSYDRYYGRRRRRYDRRERRDRRDRSPEPVTLRTGDGGLVTFEETKEGVRFNLSGH